MNKTISAYKIVTGTKLSDKITNALVVGHAFQEEGQPHYRIKLRMFPGHTYFLKKNKNSLSNYTVFSRCTPEGNRVQFKSPIGSGYLKDDFKTHLELRFPLLSTKLFMDLYPVSGGE